MNAPDLLLNKTILDVLRKHPDIQLAIIFGSLATGKAHKESDLDLAIDLGHPISAIEKSTIINELAAATGRPIDLVDLRTAGEPLLGQITRHGKRILGEDRHYAELISKHLFEQVDFLPYRNRILAERRMAWIGK